MFYCSLHSTDNHNFHDRMNLTVHAVWVILTKYHNDRVDILTLTAETYWNKIKSYVASYLIDKMVKYASKTSRFILC